MLVAAIEKRTTRAPDLFQLHSDNSFLFFFIRESDFVNEDAESWRLAIEITQQWLSHVVTPASLADGSINKALSNYVATLAVKQVCVYLSFIFLLQKS
jgi:hypothetical protein